MSVMANIFKNVKDNLTPYNDHLLLEYRKQQVNDAIDIIGVVYNEACKLFDNIEFVGYHILTPEERCKFELQESPNTSEHFNIDKSEWNLVQYNFEFIRDSGKRDKFLTYMYIPYLINNMVIINNTNYAYR